MGRVRGGREAKQARRTWALQQRKQELEQPHLTSVGVALNGPDTERRVSRIKREIGTLENRLGIGYKEKPRVATA